MLETFGIPRQDAQAVNYINIFATKVAMGPGVYMLSSADSAAISLAAANLQSAYTAAITPATRNKLTVSAKDEARNAAEALIRLYSIQIKYNAGITTQDKEAIGIAQPNPFRSQRNVPNSSPLLAILGNLPGSQTLRFSDANTPDSRRKPFGAQMLELRVAVAETVVTDVALAKPCGIFSKNPIGVAFDNADNKKVASYFGRWADTKGEVGPWSLPISMAIAA